MTPVEMAPLTGTSHVACRHCDWRQRTAYRSSYWRVQRCMEALRLQHLHFCKHRLQHLQLQGRSWKALLEVAIWWDLKTQVQREQFTVACKICVLKVKKKVVAVEREVAGSMASSSSCSSSIQTRSGPVDGDVLWMQPKHVSEHVWNGEPDRKLHIRRAVPTYQGEEQIPEEIVPLLWQCGFYWIMKMGYLKINAALISAFIERWRPETHMFHLRCGEATITLQDMSILLGLRTDGAPLIGSKNLDWADLCEELLGVRPQEGEIEGSVVKLSWLAHHFSHINIDEGNVEQLQRFTRAWILRFIGGVLFVNKSSSRVSLRYLQFLRDFEQCSTYAWGPAVLAYLYREMCSATDYKVKSIRGMCILIQMWAWERCTTLASKRTPPVIENKPLGHRWLRRGNQHIDNDDLRVFRRKSAYLGEQFLLVEECR
ncbi:Serine/threonine-protein phosphatase 7 long form [Glycine max]|nr:Serine/threonine-protein phosphatase 7 long form [Glycine max]